MKRISQLVGFLCRRASVHLHLLGLLAAVLLATSISARADVADLISLLQKITGTLQSRIGPVLTKLNAVNGEVMKFQQQVIWPLSAITHAKSAGTAMQIHYQSLFAQVTRMPMTSATLSNPSQFEAAFRGGTVSGLTQIQPTFGHVYGQVPPASNAPTMDRNMMDMDDAAAIASLKTTVISDQNSAQMIVLANRLETEALASAPGDVPLLTAQADTSNLANQAYLVKMLAAELRLEATKLAHDNAILKKSAANAGALRQQMQQVLIHP